MIVTALDFESTWTNPVNPKAALITEIGAVLWDTEERKPLDLMNELVWDSEYPESPPELTELTGITDSMLKSYGIPPVYALERLNKFAAESEAIIAHNGTFFDEPLYMANCDRFGVEPESRLWIDTRTDVDYPGHIKTRKLVHLAAEHGFANPFSHRAVFDALTMMKVLDNYRFEEVLQKAKEPLNVVIAKVSFQDKDLAKQRGYAWDGESKVWWKHLKESDSIKEANEAPFTVNIKEV